MYKWGTLSALIISIQNRCVPVVLRYLSLSLVIALAGCTIRLISDYDENTDKGVSEFQKSMETFLVRIETQERPAGPLSDAEKDFFQKAKVDLSALRVRASAIPKNEITVRMIANLTSSVEALEQLVPLGITKDQVTPIHSAFNTSVGAIIKLELEKKRGAEK